MTDSAHNVRPRTALLRIIALVLLLAPLAYAGTLLAVAVHEIVGHGLTAMALGGEFRGFAVRWDAMGWAASWPAADAPTWHRVAVLANGAFSTMILGAIFLAAAAFLRGHLFTRIALAVVSACFVLDGSMYMMWNAWHPGTPGDFGRIYQLTESEVLRWSAIVIGAAFTAFFAIVPMAIVVRESNRWLRSGAAYQSWHGAVVPILIGLAFAIGQFAFDWNQIAGGIGRTPNYWGIVFAAVLTAILLRVPEDDRPLPTPRPAILWPLVATWAGTIVMVLIVGLWLHEGVLW